MFSLNITFSVKLLITIVWLSVNLKAQSIKTRYIIETTFNDSAIVSYDDNYGSLQYNSSSSDLNFTSNLAELKTGDKKIDSLLAEKEQIKFSFQGNPGEGLFDVIHEENNNTYRKMSGTITVNNVTYPTYGYFKTENFSDRSNTNKILLDLKFEINPKVVNIPYLSDYFNHTLIFQVNDGVIMK